MGRTITVPPSTVEQRTVPGNQIKSKLQDSFAVFSFPVIMRPTTKLSTTATREREDVIANDARTRAAAHSPGRLGPDAVYPRFPGLAATVDLTKEDGENTAFTIFNVLR